MVLLLTVAKFVSTDVQSTTQMKDAFAKPVFKEGAAFVFEKEAVTPKSENNVPVFSPPFPRILKINMTDAYTILDARGQLDLTDGMRTVKRCQTKLMTNLYKQLFDQVEDEFAMLEKGKVAAQND